MNLRFASESNIGVGSPSPSHDVEFGDDRVLIDFDRLPLSVPVDRLPFCRRGRHEAASRSEVVVSAADQESTKSQAEQVVRQDVTPVGSPVFPQYVQQHRGGVDNLAMHQDSAMRIDRRRRCESHTGSTMFPLLAPSSVIDTEPSLGNAPVN